MTAERYIKPLPGLPGKNFKILRNADYELWGSRYAHVIIWRQHHRVVLDQSVYVIHHKDHDKRHNEVCDNPSPCPDWECGNLAAMTRADHIREHRPGRMGGRQIPNKIPPAPKPNCDTCGKEISRGSTRCRECYLRSP